VSVPLHYAWLRMICFPYLATFREADFSGTTGESRCAASLSIRELGPLSPNAHTAPAHHFDFYHFGLLFCKKQFTIRHIL